jgi:hypothetical protein
VLDVLFESRGRCVQLGELSRGRCELGRHVHVQQRPEVTEKECLLVPASVWLFM